MKPIFHPLLLSFVGLLVLTVAFSAPMMAQDQGYIKVNAGPSVAGVFIDGTYVGPAERFWISVKYPVSAGEHEVRLEDPRYEGKTFKVTVTAGKTTKVKEGLSKKPVAQPPFGTLKVRTDDVLAGVFLNDTYYGFVDEFNGEGQGLLLPPGDYQCKVVPAGGGAPFEQKITIEAKRTTVVVPR